MKVLMVGASGYGNVGDDAYVDVAKASWPDFEIRAVNSDHAKQAAQHVAWSDIVVMGGGGIIYCNQTDHFARMCDFMNAARHQHKPLAFWSVGVQLVPVKGKPLRTEADVLAQAAQIRPWAPYLRRARLISVRNPLDARLIEAMMPAQDERLPLLVAPDVCHAYPLGFEPQPERRTYEVVIPTSLAFREVGGVEAFIAKLQGSFTEMEVLCFSRDDEFAVAELIHAVKTTHNFDTLRVRSLEPAAALCVLKTARRVVTGRYHGAVLARAAGVSDIEVIDPRYKSRFEPRWGGDPRELADKHLARLSEVFDGVAEELFRFQAAERPLRVLYYGDFLCHTGFARVGHELLSRLHRHVALDFQVLAMNYYGEPPGTMMNPWVGLRDIIAYPAAMKYPGDWRGHRRLLELIAEIKPDVLFSLQDTFNMVPLKEPLAALQAQQPFKHVYYFPVDGDLKRGWIEDAVDPADVAVTYTQYGREQVLAAGGAFAPQFIYHGVDPHMFFPSAGDRQHTRQEMGVADDEFLIVNVNRNTPRKDLARTIDAWLHCKRARPAMKPRLYLHTVYDDPQGINLMGYMERYVPAKWHRDVIFPPHTNFPDSTLRGIYNAADAVVSTTLGEGWGFSATEAMACGRPVLLPDHTSHPEILGCELGDGTRGWLYETRGEIVLREDNDQRRPLADAVDLARRLQDLHDLLQSEAGREVVARRCEAAVDWVTAFCNWDKIAAQWADTLLAQR